jgi:hypothetical protein
MDMLTGGGGENRYGKTEVIDDLRCRDLLLHPLGRLNFLHTTYSHRPWLPHDIILQQPHLLAYKQRMHTYIFSS